METYDRLIKLAHRNTRLKAKNKRLTRVIEESVKLLRVDGENTKQKVLDLLQYALEVNQNEI